MDGAELERAVSGEEGLDPLQEGRRVLRNKKLENAANPPPLVLRAQLRYMLKCVVTARFYLDRNRSQASLPKSPMKGRIDREPDPGPSRAKAK